MGVELQLGERAVISIHGEGEDYYMYLPSHGRPQTVAKILRAAFSPEHQPKTSPGEMAGNVAFKLAQMEGVQVRLLNPKANLDEHDFRYMIERRPNGRIAVNCSLETPTDNRIFLKGFDSLSGFCRWASTQASAERVQGQVVQFKYRGGSTPGETRTILVHKLEQAKSGVRLQGLDIKQLILEQEDGRWVVKDGFRRYNAAQIDGPITVLA